MAREIAVTDAELAALARNAIYDRDLRPASKVFLPQHIAAWSPERALAALAVIAAAEKIVAGDPENVRSPIGPLHGAGIVEGWRHDCAVLQPALDTWRALP